jgi:hypothetical protein
MKPTAATTVIRASAASDWRLSVGGKSPDWRVRPGWEPSVMLLLVLAATRGADNR